MASLKNETLKPKYIDFDLNFKPSPVFTNSALGASGDILLKTDADAIKQSVASILQTNRFERPFQHNIDGRTRRLQFEPELGQIIPYETIVVERFFWWYKQRSVQTRSNKCDK